MLQFCSSMFIAIFLISALHFPFRCHFNLILWLQSCLPLLNNTLFAFVILLRLRVQLEALGKKWHIAAADKKTKSEERLSGSYAVGTGDLDLGLVCDRVEAGWKWTRWGPNSAGWVWIGYDRLNRMQCMTVVAEEWVVDCRKPSMQESLAIMVGGAKVKKGFAVIYEGSQHQGGTKLFAEK